ncbi:MAG: multifunctional CCA addition/repair protein [Betaproteobacteria bacterium]|nr:multifunctional CCA addition/repair protein [Betaproteobacteria bacterium]
MQTYLVGGAVRDALMGLPVQDRDWVVVGSTPQALLDAGFTPVGRDFPVFLHPVSREEYALARTERKTAPGYRGFVVHADTDVTLEQDLGRRDLTINAMAVAAADLRPDGSFDPAAVIDPLGGRADVQAGVLRHCTDAFREDPVRILRLARFAARFPVFETAPSTAALMREMVDAGEVASLVPERVWSELATGLMEVQPQRMFACLRACGALQVLLPEIDALWGVPQSAEHHPEIDTGVHVMMVLQYAAALAAPLEVRWACLMHDLGKATTPQAVLPRHIGHEGRSVQRARQLAQRLRVPTACADLAEVVAREHGNIHRSGELGAAALLRLLERCDALRQPARFARVLQACACDARGRLHREDSPYPQAQRLMQALEAARAVATDVLAARAIADGAQGAAIGAVVAQAREAAIAQALGLV